MLWKCRFEQVSDDSPVRYELDMPWVSWTGWPQTAGDRHSFAWPPHVDNLLVVLL